MEVEAMSFYLSRYFFATFPPELKSLLWHFQEGMNESNPPSARTFTPWSLPFHPRYLFTQGWCHRYDGILWVLKVLQSVFIYQLILLRFKPLWFMAFQVVRAQETHLGEAQTSLTVWVYCLEAHQHLPKMWFKAPTHLWALLGQN